MKEHSELWRGVAYNEDGECLGRQIVRGDNTEHAHRLLADWFESVCPGSGQLDMWRLQARPPQVTVTRPRPWPVGEPQAPAVGTASAVPRAVPWQLRYR